MYVKGKPCCGSGKCRRKNNQPTNHPSSFSCSRGWKRGTECTRSVRPGLGTGSVVGCREASPDRYIHSCVCVCLCVLCLSSCCLFAHCIVLDVCVCVRCFYLYFTFLLKQCCCCLSKDRHDAVTRVWPSCRMANDRHDLVSAEEGALWVFYARVSCTHYSRVTGSVELVRLCCLCVCV